MTAAMVDASAILGVSANMLAAAQAGAWDELAVQVTERERLLRRWPTTDVSAIETLKALQMHNDEIKTLVGKARDHVAEALGQHQRTHRALSAYLHTAAD